jgi:membrane fusion protein, multidrug efflux system
MKYLRSNGWMGVLAAIVMSACGEKKDAPPAAAAGPVKIDARVVSMSPFESATAASGTVMANEFVELKPEVSGRIVQLNMQEGQLVSAGTLLVKLNDEELQAQLKKYKAQVDIADKTEKR